MDSEIRSLTGLRGIAALLVAILHIHQPGGDNWISAFFRHGYLAVDLFFVLSGFVMALTYGSMFEQGFSGKAYGTFLAKRLARIYPLYFLVTGTIAVIGVVADVQSVQGRSFVGVVFMNLAMVQAWGMAPSLMPVAWSISTEWAAYLLFPLLATSILRGRASNLCILIAISAASIAALAHNNSHFMGSTETGGYGPLDITRFDSFGPLVRCIASFSLGIVAYRLRGVSSVRKWLGNSKASMLLCIAAVSAACIPGTDPYVVMIFPALVASLSLQTSTVSMFLSGKAAYSLGLWSYSIYLVHRPFGPIQAVIAEQLSTFLPWGASILASGLTLAVVLVVSATTYATIEKPCRSLLQSILGIRAGDMSNGVPTPTRGHPNMRQSGMGDSPIDGIRE